MSRTFLAVLLLPVLGACVVPDGARPEVTLGVEALSQFNHRGMVMNDTGVVQPSVEVALPAKEEGTIVVRGSGNIDLSNDTGDAWFPDGKASKFTQLDWDFLYLQGMGDFDLTFGVVSYNQPFGTEFPFGIRGATTEFLVAATTEVGGVFPSLRLHYDFDEVDGLYVQGVVGKDFPLGEDWLVDAELSLGYMDDNQAFWNYAQAPATSGLSDLRATGRAFYAIDEHTTATFTLGLSTIVDSEFQDWFDLIGIEDTNVWAGVGIQWAY